MNRRRLFLILGAVLVLLVAGTAFVLVKRHNDKKDDGVTGAQEQKVVQKIIGDENQRVSKLADKVKKLDDLKKLPDQDQGKVGLLIISKDTNKELVQQIIVYLMLRNDSYGIDASRYCFAKASSQAEKDKCVARATEQARSQGIIGPKDQLPEGYVDNSKEGEQG